ncbi:hypothetical protein V6N13_037787 [Hibiscus sabdariffa]
MVFYGDDEEEGLFHFVSNYCFHDEEDEPVCFSRLPLHFGWKECSSDASKTKIFFRREANDGLLKICKHVILIVWRFDLSNARMPIESS